MNRPEIVSALETLPSRLREAIAGLDTHAARSRPEKDDWSVTELVCHVRDYVEIFNSRIPRLVREDNPNILAFDNEDLSSSREYASQDLHQVAEVAAGLRTQTLRLLREVPAAAWSRTAVHPEWGTVSLEWLMNRCAEHEAEHLADIAAVRARLSL